jgi:phosphatidylserine decarboxylase
MKKIFCFIFSIFEDFCQKLTTKIANFLANSKNTRVKNMLINIFLQKFEVNMDDATNSQPFEYSSFNAFFTRSLKPGARVICDKENSIVSPVDGTISEAGAIEKNKLLQAKSMSYELEALINNKDAIKDYVDGSFATLYLAPTDYHRIHLPYTGKLISMCYVPGRLYPVKPEKVATVENIFAINERLICHFMTDVGPYILVMVGAQLVSGIETVWHGPIKQNKTKSWDYSKQNLVFNKGQEIGRFNFGSTVILCLNKNIKLSNKITKNRKILLGSKIGTTEK